MATQWGSNSLAPNTSAGWFFARPNVTGFLPVLRVMPLTPSFTGNLWNTAGDGYPYWNELGVSTVWSQLADDLSGLTYFMVVTNNSNNVVEYAFLEADLAGPPNATSPAAGLGSNSNYLLSDNCNSITNLTVTIDVTEDIVGSDGFGFQVNAYSGAGDYDGGQQYLIFLSPGSNQLSCMIDNWTNTATGVQQIINTIVPLATLPGTDLPAGYRLTIALQNDGNANVTGAAYGAFDNNGNSLGNVTLNILSQTDLVTGNPATAADLAPIVAFQLDFVDYLNGGNTTLSSGAGTITYTASNALTALSTEPACVDWDYVTVETANSVYGPLPAGASQTLVQSFSHGAASAVIRKKARVMKATRLAVKRR
jgi:hypothetical protein